MASAGGSSSKSTAPPVPTLGMPSVLPYDGDRDLNVAIQTALTQNDTTALRILFQAQKMRSKLRRSDGAELSSEGDARLRQALEVIGVSREALQAGRKRKRSEVDDETKEEEVMRDEKRDDDDDMEEAEEGGGKQDLVEACKAALKAPTGLRADASGSVLATADGVTPQLLRTLSTESLWHYTQAIAQPDTAPRLVLTLLRGISKLQHNSTVSKDASRLLKAAVGKGQLTQVETVLRDVYNALPANGENGDLDGEEASSLGDDGLQAEFRCPITQDLFYEPATLTCGHSFERQGILSHIKACQRSGNAPCCPSCRKIISKEEQKKLGVNKVLQGLLRRFYSAQMESLAEREVEKTAASGATGAERIVEILERYPENVSILRRTVEAFEAWAKDPANIKLLASERVLAALVRAMRDPVRLSAAKEKADIELARLITGMLALVTQEARAVRTIIRMGFLKDVVAIIASEPTTVEALVLVRNLLVGEGFTGLIRRAKKDATVMPSAIQHLNGISVGLFNASNRPTVRQDARLAIFLIASLNRLTKLAAHEGILACQVDFSALARAVVTLWDHHTLNAAVLIRAMRGLRSLLDLTAPANIPDQQTPQACLSHPFYLDRCLRALSEFGPIVAAGLATAEIRTAVAETVIFLVALAFDDRGGIRDRALVDRLRQANVLVRAEELLRNEADCRRLLGVATQTPDDFRFERVSDASKVVLSEDGKQVEIQGAAWVLGPPIREGQTCITLEFGKAACNRETLWWGVCVLDKEVDEAGGLAPDTSANSPNSPFVVRREGALYAQGRSDRYLYLSGWRDNKVMIKVDMAKKSVSFGNAKVGWQSFENKVVRPAIVTMPNAGMPRTKVKYKAAIKDFSSGFLIGPQPLRLKPLARDCIDYLGRGKVARRSANKNNSSTNSSTANKNGSASSSSSSSDGSRPPTFAFAVGPGEYSDEEEVLFRFRGVKKNSTMCFGVIGVGRRDRHPPQAAAHGHAEEEAAAEVVVPETKTPARRGRRGATATASSPASAASSSGGAGKAKEAAGGGGGPVLSGGPVDGSECTVLFLLTIMSTGDVTVRGPGLRPMNARIRLFGSVFRRQVRVTWGSRGGLQVLSNATTAGRKDGNGDGELLWDSKTALRGLLSRSDVVVHPFVGLERGGDWACVRVVAPQMSPPCGPLWLRRCLASVKHDQDDKQQQQQQGKAPADEAAVEGPVEDRGMKELARSGPWDCPSYASLLHETLLQEAKDHLEQLVPVPKRNKTTIHAYGYDLGTLQEMAKGRLQHCSTRIDRMNLIAMPELSNETVQVNKLMIAGRMERLWLLSLKWFMDRDLYQIEAVREVPVPAGLSAPAESEGEGGAQQQEHTIFEIPVDPPFRLENGLNLGVALGGSPAHVLGFRNNKFIQHEMVVMALSDDVARDMVVGKELCMEEQTEETALAIGFDTVEGLPSATCTTADIAEGAYRMGAWEMPESSDEEGALRSNQRYRRLRFDVFLRTDGQTGASMEVDEEGEGDEEEEEDEEALLNFL